jgi:hypothetical protein
MSSGKKYLMKVPGAEITPWGSSQAKKAAEEAASDAANEQQRQFQSMQDMQWEMYQQSRSDVAPWREAGEEALGEYQGLLEGGLSQYEMSEAGQAQADYMAEMTSSAAAAQGQFQSERTPLSVAAAKMGVQQNEYQSRLANYAQLSGIGYGAGTTQAGISQAYSAQATDLSIQGMNLTMAQQAAAQQRQSQMAGGQMGMLGGIAGFALGGPAGAQMGSQFGQSYGQTYGGFV